MRSKEEIIEEFSRTFKVSSVLKDIDEIGRKDFMIYFLSHEYMNSHNNFLLDAKSVWGDFTYQNWISIFDKIQHNSVGVTAISSFLYKYLKINSIEIINDMTSITEANKEKINKVFFERKGLFAFDRGDEFIMKKNNLDFEDVTIRLLNEGAPPAVPIEPRYIKLD
jgi:hypothetical protein